jgi:BirA family biotin operon repressor/biotin-[acetyl-CoA-carboxylase] ligase
VTDARRAILEALADGPVTGPALAERLEITRAAVWKHVEALREAGFEVASDDEGYRIVDVPEYGALAVEYELEAPFTVEYHDAIPSTNERARELAADGATDVVVLADEQTGGRGRLDREWTSPSGGIWLSVVCRPDLAPPDAPILTLGAAVAVADAAREAGVDAGIKWPNDVLGPDGGKLAGVLTEMAGETDRVEWIVVGMGINANVDASTLPEGASSLQDHVGPIDRRRFLQRVLERFAELRADPEVVLDAWRERAVTLGQRVRVDTGDATVVGQALNVRRPGSLQIRTDDGETVVVAAGDCEHLRPA